MGAVRQNKLQGKQILWHIYFGNTWEDISIITFIKFIIFEKKRNDYTGVILATL